MCGHSLSLQLRGFTINRKSSAASHCIQHSASSVRHHIARNLEIDPRKRSDQASPRVPLNTSLMSWGRWDYSDVDLFMKWRVIGRPASSFHY
ncbi:unnamed protein product [Linum trigynum]|uniref:Uncharacterized protein n=1 Tax=Linum trigynum TaxID=586398 RepID=A0AAV2CNL3_9ROSI